jgi:hypothetical protein
LQIGRCSFREAIGGNDTMLVQIARLGWRSRESGSIACLF